MIDSNGKTIRQKELRTSKKIVLINSAAFAIWSVMSMPQQIPILNIFLRNYAHLSYSQIGIFTAVTQLAGLSGFLALLIYSIATYRKKVVIVAASLQRLYTLMLIFIAFYMGSTKNELSSLFIVMLYIAAFVGQSAGAIAGSGWLSWMADLLPENSRASFFGVRSMVLQLTNIIVLALILRILQLANDSIYFVYAILFSVSIVFGILDPLLLWFIPEPKNNNKIELKQILANIFVPLKNRTFVYIATIVGVGQVAILAGFPFITTYISDPKGLGKSQTWIGIIFIISQTAWLLIAPSWGRVMSRLGSKLVFRIGLFAPVMLSPFYFITNNNFIFIIICIALLYGLLAPAFWDGIGALNMAMADKKNRTIHVIWFVVISGGISALGPLIGGTIIDRIDNVNLSIGAYKLQGIYGAILFSQLLALLVIVLLKFAKINKDSSMRSLLLYRSITIIGQSSITYRIEKALRNVNENLDADLAVDQIIRRMADPDQEIREEATRTLGRVNSLRAVDVLIEELKDYDSPVRVIAARSLGRLGALKAVPYLVDALSDKSDELQEACANALGKIDSSEAVDALLLLLKDPKKSIKVSTTSASALSILGKHEAAYDIFALMQKTTNETLYKQLGISLGNTIGVIGEFYPLLTGTEEQQYAETLKLIKNIRKNIVLISQSLVGKERESFLRHSNELTRDLSDLIDQEDYQGISKVSCQMLMNLAYTLLNSYNIEDVVSANPNIALINWLVKQFLTMTESSKVIGQLSLYILFHRTRVRASYNKKLQKKK